MKTQSNMRKSIRDIFTEVAGTYEIANHIMTFGLDTMWRKRAARIAAESSGTRWLDVCSGTGEMAGYLARLAPKSIDIYAVDFSLPMLKMAMIKPGNDGVRLVVADVSNLPFADNALDLITISFATRNINLSKEKLIRTFKEFHRILRSGGVFLNLETSQPSWPFIRRVVHLYVRLSVRRIGYWISGSDPGYTYLSNTIPRFYAAEELAEIMSQAGFSDIWFKKLTFGAAAIHRGIKPD
jgi:demethylmenaquinone methyltransferase/2-methoxy-6-polyprenyl-1,4-benzoquinol methylase